MACVEQSNGHPANSDPPQVIVYGASGHAFAIAEVVRGFRQGPLFEVQAFVEDDPRSADLHGVPIISFADWQSRAKDLPVVIGVGNPAHKRRMAEKIAGAGGYFRRYYVDKFAMPGVTAGSGSLLAQQAYYGFGIEVGAHATVMPMCSVGHDVRIGDYCTISPGAIVSGNVIIEDGTFLGAGSVVTNGTRDRPLCIGEGAVVAAGAVVTKSVGAGATVIGNPAVPVTVHSRWRNALRRIAAIPHGDL